MYKKIFAILIIFFSIVTLLLLTNKVEASVVSEYTGSIYELAKTPVNNYETYLSNVGGQHTDETVIIDAKENYIYDNALYSDEPYETNVLGRDGLFIPETGDISWKINVQTSGLYNIKIDYYTIEGRSAEISRGIQINGSYPFTEAENFVLSRVWHDEFDVSTRHIDGKHDLKPSQIEKQKWNVSPIRDTRGYYGGLAYDFYFEAGENIISLIQDREPVVISSITLYHEENVKTYSEMKKDYQLNNYQTIGSANFSNSSFKKIQGESAYEKSSPILSPVANWSSYKVDPYVKFMTRYNTIGGTTWRVPGDWISWEFDAPEAGLYQLTFKVLQNYSRGMYSSRILYINGKIPFEECRNIQFAYDNDWQNVTLGNDDEKYLFYFHKGTNIITLESTIGVYADIIRNTEETIAILNNLYRKVVMIAGTTPDKYQDYMLAQRIDGLYKMIDDSIEKLEFSIDQIISIAGERSPLISSFERTLYQMNKFKISEQKIQEGLKELEDNIAALGTWVMRISEQSLAIDCIYVHGQDAKLPKASTNFFQKLWHEIVMLFGSYGANTSLKSSLEVDGPTITVWIASGRDQSQLLRQLIDESFTAQKNINVELKLVSQQALLPATLSGNGPDVAIGVAQNVPVNWGIRNALVDLSTFPDYHEVSQWFHESAVTPFAFREAVFALPDTQDFLVSFVRTDIIRELKVTTPKTWTEVIDTLPVLQRQYLDYYLPNTRGALSPLMYAMIIQNGGSLYKEDGKSTLLNEPQATKAFIDFTKFYSEYGFEVSAAFSNRFRSGEMPIGVSNFSLYNTLSVFAPEIRGQWEFDLLPGYADEEGNINNTSTSTVTGTIILESSKEKLASWEFVKWWLGEEAQTGYARGMEAILGAAARYPTANLEAFKNLPWSTKDYMLLTKQRENSVGVPIVPGDYIVGRYIDNAFRSSVNSNVNPRDSLYEYAEKINIELKRKREEFNLD